MKFKALAFICLCAWLLAACSIGTPSVVPSPAATSTAAGEVAADMAAPLETPTPAGPLTLRLWLPPQFAPGSGTPAGELLQARLKEYDERRPDVKLEVRVKAAEGPGGLLETLSAASAAAPLTLPDLVALPYPAFEAAALKGLLHPLDGLAKTLDAPDWYGYARQMAHVREGAFGVPFAGDALLVVYRQPVVSDTLSSWPALQQGHQTLVFPAADPQALFTLAQYQAAGGLVQDDQGRPTLDPQVLTRVLAFYQQGESSGLMPYWLTQYQDDPQVWASYQEGHSNLAVTWASNYLGAGLSNTLAAPLPTPNGAPFTLGRGWVWAIPATQSENQQQAAELARFLVDSPFLAQWTEAAGVLPTRPSAAAGWKDTGRQALASQVAESAQLTPPAETLGRLGVALQQAALQVIKRQNEPAAAAQKAADSVAAANK